MPILPLATSATIASLSIIKNKRQIQNAECFAENVSEHLESKAEWNDCILEKPSKYDKILNIIDHNYFNELF